MEKQIEDFYRSLRCRRVAFIGTGVTNQQCIELFARCGAQITLCDKKPDIDAFGPYAQALRKLDIRFSLGEHYLDGLAGQEMIMRTPGFEYYTPELVAAREAGAEVTSEMELFFRLCPCKIVAVTGSDGKTTTTTLIAKILEAAGYTVHLGGNLGRALLPVVDAIAANYHAELVEVLTGFKYIGQQILKTEKEGRGTYLFGLEESYGCLIGTYARDKDAISATVALCEAAAYYKMKNMTLWDAMVAMYDKYGYYKDAVKAIELKGIEGLAKIQEILESLRKNPPVKVGDYQVISARDYKLDTIKDMATGEVKPTGLPSSNVLYYDMNDGAWLCVRPSGTEPKVKFYYGIKGTSLEDADAKSAKLGQEVMDMVQAML